MLTPNGDGLNLQQTFIGYVMMFAKRYNFTPSMAPFANRMHGSEWFTRKFPAPSKDQEAESLAIRQAFLTHRLMLTRLRQSRNQFTLLSYQPNIVSRKFVFIQIMPKPLFAKKNSFILYNMIHTEAQSIKLLGAKKVWLECNGRKLCFSRVSRY